MISTKLGVTLASVFALLRLASGSIPSEPTNLNITSIGSRSINISWTKPAGSNGSILNYVVLYKEVNSGPLQMVEVQNVAKATLPVKPYRKYDIYVMASNQDGYGTSTSKKNVTTAEEEPGKCPEMEPPEERHNRTTLVIIWSKIPKENQNGIMGYRIFYNKTGVKNVTVNNPDTTIYTFYNMTEKDNYGFKVLAFNSAGYCKGYQNISFVYEVPVTTSPAVTTTAAATVVSSTAAATVVTPTAAATATAAATVVTPTAAATAETTTAVTTSAEAAVTGTSASTQNVEATTKSKGPMTDGATPGKTLARTDASNWMVYILIALAIIIVIMGVTIFLLIWQLYKNRREYKVRQQREVELTTNRGIHNEAHDNTV